MIHSNLQKIIQRLDAMAMDQSSDQQVREFAQYGVPVCKVTYRQSTGEFLVERYDPEQKLTFDNLDLAAIEIYECLYDFHFSF
ncbi:YkuJ family protein [Limosilactobacillus caecicola]|uniref:YkuJ family protein n=1 Tax=Limosilactobacillus caecicola TaxID=2941332 RepID=UPI00203E5432|nr:YkuJ family protein [Limosilactobacillus caecicola]